MGAAELLAVVGFVVAWIVVLAVVARRMLQLRAGPLRLVLAGVAGVATAAVAVGQRTEVEGWPFVLLWIGIGVLSAMGVLIVAEFIAPAGTGPQLIRWYRAFRSWRRRTRRYAQIDRLISALETGRFSTSTRVLADERDQHFITRLVHQALLALIATAAGIIGAILLGTDGGPQVARTLSLFQLIAYSLLIVSGALALRVLTSILRTNTQT